MKRIVMDFPKDPMNAYWDGKTHQIIPEFLAQINNSSYYYMQGYDETFGTKMLTVLQKTDEGFAKVPLADSQEYVRFNGYCVETRSNGGLHQHPVEELNDHVPCLPIKPVAQVIRESADKSK